MRVTPVSIYPMGAVNQKILKLEKTTYGVLSVLLFIYGFTFIDHLWKLCEQSENEKMRHLLYPKNKDEHRRQIRILIFVDILILKIFFSNKL